MVAGLTIQQMEYLSSKGLSLDEVIEFAKMSEKPRSANAERQARFRSRRKASVTNDVTNNVTDNALPPPIDNIHTPPVSSDEETTPPAEVTKIVVPKPEGVSGQVWADFLQSRKARRAPVTTTVVAGISREAAKAGWTLEAALAESVARGWQSFKAEWVHGAPARPPDPGGSSLVQSILAKQAAAVGG